MTGQDITNINKRRELLQGWLNRLHIPTTASWKSRKKTKSVNGQIDQSTKWQKIGTKITTESKLQVTH